MPNTFFQFKQFTVWHDRCAMKVGTDGTLLGAWVNIGSYSTILDIGTGSGLIALMIAQRNPLVKIDAIDIDEDSCLQASENSEKSPFSQQINIHHAPFQSFASKTKRTYELIVSNPPYFRDSLKCPDVKRSQARHNEGLSLDELLTNSCSILAPNGKIALILPFQQKKEIMELSKKNDLFCNRLTHVYPKKQSSPKRILLELSKQPIQSCELTHLTLENERHQRTEDYYELTKEFYL